MPPRAACWVDANQYLHIPQAARRLLHLERSGDCMARLQNSYTPAPEVSEPAL